MAELTREASLDSESGAGGWYRHLARWLFPFGAAEPRSVSEIRAKIRQQLEAAEAALEAKRRRIEELGQLVTRLDQQRSSLDQAVQDQQRAADAALVEGREDQARAALRGCVSRRREVERFGNRLRGVEAEKLALATLLTDQERRLEALRRDLDDHCRAREAPPDTVPQEPSSNDPIDEEEIELEMLRRKRSLAERPRDEEKVPHATDSV